MLSIVITWRNRKELIQAIPSIVASANKVGGEVIVVNYSGDADELEKQLYMYSENIKVVMVEGQTFFNKSAAQNLGVLYSTFEILFFCDCDIICNSAEVEILVNKLIHKPNIFATVAGVKEIEVNSRKAKHVTKFGYELFIETADGRQLRIIDNEEDGKDGSRQAPGLLFVRKSDLLKVQGYNSELEGWGWEDQDMISRLILGGGLKRIQEGDFKHISHDDAARMSCYPEFSSRWESRDKMFRKALKNYDDNNFLGSYSKDIKRLCSKVTND